MADNAYIQLLDRICYPTTTTITEGGVAVALADATTEDQEIDFTVAAVLKASKPSGPLSRLEEVESDRMKEIEQLECFDPLLGDYINVYGFKDLCDLLDLSDTVFAEVYPELHMNREQRVRLKAAVIAHRRDCYSCQQVADNHTWADGVLHGLVDLAIRDAVLTEKASK